MLQKADRNRTAECKSRYRDLSVVDLYIGFFAFFFCISKFMLIG